MKLRVTIERSLIPGSSSNMIWVMVFLVFFFGQMLLCFALPFVSGDGDLEEIFSIIILATSALLSSVIIYIDEKRHGSTEQLQISTHEDHIILVQGRKKFCIPITQMKEVARVMLFNRFYPEKGKYKVVIKRRKHRSITFMTTDEEYNNHVDFEDTELSKFYDALRRYGVKCC